MHDYFLLGVVLLATLAIVMLGITGKDLLGCLKWIFGQRLTKVGGFDRHSFVIEFQDLNGEKFELLVGNVQWQDSKFTFSCVIGPSNSMSAFLELFDALPTFNIICPDGSGVMFLDPLVLEMKAITVVGDMWVVDFMQGQYRDTVQLGKLRRDLSGPQGQGIERNG